MTYLLSGNFGKILLFFYLKNTSSSYKIENRRNTSRFREYLTTKYRKNLKFWFDFFQKC